MKDISKGKKLDFTIADVNDIYSGPVGILWEMLMGEQIHVGGERETDILSEKAGITQDTHLLDICCALGGPARHLAKKYGCTITGIDATKKMIEEAAARTKKAGLSHLITYRLGNALDLPFKKNTFNMIWGQDAWCYVTDKEKLIQEAHRVLIPGGIIAFTDWLQVGTMSVKEWEDLNSFMAFPYMETLDGYEKILKKTGYTMIEKQDLSQDFRDHCYIYQKKLRQDLKQGIINTYGKDMFEAADEGLAKWVKAADEGKVGRGRLIGKKR